MELNTTKAHGSVTEITVRVLKAPKTDSSIRKVYIPSSVAILLAELREEQKETIEALGDMYENYNLVLATSYGLPLGESYLRDKMQEVIDREGLPDVVFHSLRHTSVTYIDFFCETLLNVSGTKNLFDIIETTIKKSEVEDEKYDKSSVVKWKSRFRSELTKYVDLPDNFNNTILKYLIHAQELKQNGIDYFEVKRILY